MLESAPNPNDSPPSASQRRMIRWDAVAAIVASLVGLLALIVAAYTASIQRQQVRAQVWPYLIGEYSGGRFELAWINKGVGPAIVRSVEVTINGKSQGDWNTVLRSLGVPQLQFNQSFLNGNVLSPGETVDWIKFSNRTDYDTFMHAVARTRSPVEVCYCSSLGDCWRTRFAESSRRPVSQCPAVPASKQFNE